MTTKESKDGTEQEDYDEEFFYGFDDPEFQKVYSLCEQWCATNNISGGGYNSDMGEAFARNFEEFVRTEHSEVAKMVEKDLNIYEAVFMEWSSTAESDKDEDEGDVNIDDDDEEKENDIQAETTNPEAIAQNVPTTEPSEENETAAQQTDVFDVESLDSSSDGDEDADEDDDDLVAANDSENVEDRHGPAKRQKIK